MSRSFHALVQEGEYLFRRETPKLNRVLFATLSEEVHNEGQSTEIQLGHD